MSKEKLRFKVGGRSIVYEGEASKRPQDLMEILVKLRTANDDVVPTFRENIEEQDSYTDADIMEMFEAARHAREEKRRAREESDKKPSDEPERPQKISLSFRGKVFSYEGLLSHKQSAVVQLLCKQPGVTQEIAWETFRANLPDSPLGEEEVWELVTSAQALRRQQREQQQRQNEPEPPAEVRHSHHGATSSGSAAVEAPHSETVAGGEEIDDMNLASFKELQQMPPAMREELNKYISDVISQPPPDCATLLKYGIGAGTASHVDAAMTDDASELGATARSPPGKVAVYCQEGNNATKVVYIAPTTTFEELAATVEKKYGRAMALSFYEGDDIIELDDDDVLSMFLEMGSGEKRKLKLLCSPAGKRVKAVDDILTSTKPTTSDNAGGRGEDDVPPVKAFSTGELTVKELRTYTGHSLAVYCCAFSPSGSEFITASRDRSVRLWNVKAGSCTVMKGGHNDLVLSCDFSPKGNKAVSAAADATIKIWRTSNCSKIATLRGHSDKVYCVQYNPSGDYIVSGSVDNTVRVWNAEKATKVATLRGHSLAVFSCCFSKSDNGKYVASGSDDRLIKIWDWESKSEVRSLVGHVGTVWSVAYSHDDKLLVSSSMDHELKLWDPRTGVCVRTLEGHEMPIHHAVFSMSDKYIFSCARDWSVMIWRTEDGERVETLAGHRSTVYHLDLWGKNRLLTSSLDETLKLWEFEEN